MPKKRRRRKARPAPQPHRVRAAAPPPGEPPLLAEVRGMLQEAHPGALLEFASSVLAAVDPRGHGPLAPADDHAPESPTLAELAGTFIAVPCRETTALLTVLAEMADDELVVQRLRRELTRRDDRLPVWLERLAPVTVERAVVVRHVLGDGDNVMLTVRTGAGHDLTVIVYIDHNLGTVVKDGFVIHEPIDAVLGSFRSAMDPDPDTVFAELDLADARARATEAIEIGAISFPPFETDTWPVARPLVEWVVRQLPEGGAGYERPEWSEEDRSTLTEAFFASDFARGHQQEEDRQLFESLLWFGCDYGPGDPLRWSPVAVEVLLTDWLPRKIVADAEFLARAPALLRGLIRFSHGERGIRPALTDETLAAVDEYEPGYQRTIRSPRPQGPEALLAAMGVLGDEVGAPLWDLGEIPRYEDQMLALLDEAVGEAALPDLDDAPLPDEPLGLSRVPEDVRDRVDEVARLVGACCEELLDVEHRTACRRLLADVAAAEPDIFRRRARAATAAAALVWIVVKANHGFSQREGGLTAKALGAWFGVGGSPGQRAPTLLRAIGVRTDTSSADLRLGTPRYLVADRRRWIVEMRDRYQPQD